MHKYMNNNILYKIRIGGMVAFLVLGAACFRQDRRTITVHVPQLRQPDCFRFIQDAVKSVEGIEGVVPHYEAGTVDVTYNAIKLGIRNIEFVIAGAGFDANDTKAPAQARAALPEGCR